MSTIPPMLVPLPGGGFLGTPKTLQRSPPTQPTPVHKVPSQLGRAKAKADVRVSRKQRVVVEKVRLAQVEITDLADHDTTLDQPVRTAQLPATMASGSNLPPRTLTLANALGALVDAPQRAYAHRSTFVSASYAALWVLAHHTDTISIEQWAVECWQRFPQQFAMKEYPQHPNMHAIRVLASKLNQQAHLITANGRVCITQRGKSAVRDRISNRIQK